MPLECQEIDDFFQQVRKWLLGAPCSHVESLLWWRFLSMWLPSSSSSGTSCQGPSKGGTKATANKTAVGSEFPNFRITSLNALEFSSGLWSSLQKGCPTRKRGSKVKKRKTERQSSKRIVTICFWSIYLHPWGQKVSTMPQVWCIQ